MGNFLKDPWGSIGGRKVEKQIDRSVGDVGRQIDRSTQDFAEVASLGLHSYMRTQKHRAADYQAQTAASNKAMVEAMENLNRERADYALFDRILRARRVAGQSQSKRHAFTSPLGLSSDVEWQKKQLLGQ